MCAFFRLPQYQRENSSNTKINNINKSLKREKKEYIEYHLFSLSATKNFSGSSIQLDHKHLETELGLELSRGQKKFLFFKILEIGMLILKVASSVLVLK